MEAVLKIMGVTSMLAPFFVLILLIFGIILMARWINANLGIQNDKNQFHQAQKVLINELIETLKKGNKQMV